MQLQILSVWLNPYLAVVEVGQLDGKRSMNVRFNLQFCSRLQLNLLHLVKRKLCCAGQRLAWHFCTGIALTACVAGQTPINDEGLIPRSIKIPPAVTAERTIKPDGKNVDRAGFEGIPATVDKRRGTKTPDSVLTPDIYQPSQVFLPTPDTSARHTVVVNAVPASEVLFALARDESLNLEIIGRVDGQLTLNAVEKPLTEILRRISRQVDVTIESTIDGYVVSADVPVVRTYSVDYLNMQRSSHSSVDLATQVGSISTSVDGKSGGGSLSNNSQMRIENTSDNSFWDSLTDGIAGILEKPASTGDAKSKTRMYDDVFVNRESGFITVRATARQHRQIATLVDRAVSSAQRQVLIEATVVEVTLSDSFESGIDWRILDRSESGIDFSQLLTGSGTAADARAPVTGLLTYRNSASSIGDVTATLKLLEQFGDVKVLSSPKIIALNNQPAVLKIVDNRVYFTFEVDRLARENGDERTIVDSTVHTVPVGLVMNVTPFINKASEVILNVRPSISRILNFAEDPSPALAGQAQIRNLIPEIQVREMESLLRVASGEVAIIGGLMQNRIDNSRAGLPGLSRIPFIGRAFSHDNNRLEKTELLVFLRPTVLQGTDSPPGLLSQLTRLRGNFSTLENRQWLTGPSESSGNSR